MVRLAGIACPRCDFQASSLFDLELHAATSHCPDRDALPGAASLRTAPLPDRIPAFAPASEPMAVPETDRTFWVEGRTARFLHAVRRRTERGEIVNVLLVGPTGTGKSSLPRHFAAIARRPFFTMHCQLIVEQEDWWGSREASTARGTYVHKGALVDAIETPGCVILLDEANRTHPENLNTLFGFLDHRRDVWVPLLHREVAVAPGVVFFVTLNEGMDYVGTNGVDRAFRDRIATTIRLDYLPRDVEADVLVKRTGLDKPTAEKLVEFAGITRNNPKLEIAVSTRLLLECAALVSGGLPIRDSALFTIINGAADDTDRKALLQALQMGGLAGEVSIPLRWDDEE